MNNAINNNNKGRIIASVAGDYSVFLPESGNVVVCKARGLFRLKKISPCVGDYVTLSLENNDYVISDIEERKNVLVRPPLANLDCAVIVVSSCEPKPNALVIDRLIVIFESKDIEASLVFTKLDKSEAALSDLYRKAGFSCFFNDDIQPLSEYLHSKTSALIGNTGVGKTTLLNRLIPGLSLPTAEISKKLGRGKHTTRTVVLHKLPPAVFEGAKGEAGYIADTPGFSTVESRFYGAIASSDAALHFREFREFLGNCKFGGCTHNGEDGCAICGAVESGAISRSRYDSYKAIYREAKKAENEY
ncbi:MAG: ribosome small subunit-dependent GTPase A [Oscillospiraceae bacterium]|nr:ribosome small subunit-dependent GTPase A [Oscillospiraceae bacterium]